MNREALALMRVFSPVAYAGAMRMDQLMRHALALGLDQEATSEVVHTWQVRYQQLLDPFDFNVVEKALSNRAAGGRWTPPTVDEVNEAQRRLDAQRWIRRIR